MHISAVQATPRADSWERRTEKERTCSPLVFSKIQRGKIISNIFQIMSLIKKIMSLIIFTTIDIVFTDRYKSATAPRGTVSDLSVVDAEGRVSFSPVPRRESTICKS